MRSLNQFAGGMAARVAGWQAKLLQGLVLVLLLPGCVWAAAPAVAAGTGVVVEAVQMPAWLERAGSQPRPVQAGMEIRSGDLLRTGARARLLLRTPDGSTVKLGENARFRMDGIEMRPGNVFAASLQVLQGAFRFTTAALSRARSRRDLSVNLPTATAGIRGTDLWGKSAPGREVFCLIEGRIEVTPQNEAALVMDQPLQFYVRENGVSQPVGMVDAAQLRQWAAETEIEPGRGAARRGGLWQVTLATTEGQADALKIYDAVRADGYAATILPVELDGAVRYRVRLSGLASKAEADALASVFRGRPGIAEPIVSR